MRKNKFLIFTILFAVTTGTVSAEDYMFDRFAVGLELGTTGAGLEVAAPVTRFVTLRAGFTGMYPFSYTKDVNYKFQKQEYTTPVQAKLNMFNGKFLANIYPFEKLSFHLTTGLYFGTSQLIQVQNTESITVIGRGEGVEVGGKLITPDDDGFVKANISTAGVKPYFGIGFGRPVSDKHFNVSCDLGVQYWGTPTVNAWSPDEEEWATFEADDIDNEDFVKYMGMLSKAKIFPVLNVRFYYCF